MALAVVEGFVSSPMSQRTRTSLKASNANEIMPMKRGTSVAIVTPMNADTGKVDFDDLRRLLRYHVDAGTDNLCILGTTGEASVLTEKEKEDVLKIAVEEVKGIMPILVGTGTIDPTKIKAATQQARDLGCDAALVVTPYYVKPPQRALVNHFMTVADWDILPVVPYNVPGRTGVNMMDENLALISQHPNIVALKDATGDVDRLVNLRKLLAEQQNTDFLLYSGDDGTTIDFIARGGDGCISVTANVAAKQLREAVHAALAGDVETANKLNEPLVDLHQKLFVEANPIPAKWAAAHLGLIKSAYARPPLCEMDDKYAPEVTAALIAAGVLEPAALL